MEAFSQSPSLPPSLSPSLGSVGPEIMTDCVNGQTVPSRVYTFFGHGGGGHDGRHGRRRRRRDQTIRAQSYALRDWKSGAKEGRKGKQVAPSYRVEIFPPQNPDTKTSL